MTKQVLKCTLQFFFLLAIACPIIFLMSACGGNTSIDGTWKIVSTTQGDTTKDRDTITSELTDNSKTLDEQFSLLINQDNTFSLLTPASSTAQTGTWRKEDSASEDTYKLTTLDNKVYTITYEDSKKIKVQIDETTYYIMNK